MKKFIVYRDAWCRGKGDNYSKLRRSEDGTMCCLGFLALTCGATKELITDHGLLDHINVVVPKKVRENQRIIAQINDNELRSEELRESDLKTMFKECDIEIEFLDGKLPEGYSGEEVHRLP